MSVDTAAGRDITLFHEQYTENKGISKIDTDVTSQIFKVHDGEV